MVKLGTGTKGTRFVTTDYPNESGLIAGTTKQEGRRSNLVPTKGSLVPRSKKVGL